MTGLGAGASGRKRTGKGAGHSAGHGAGHGANNPRLQLAKVTKREKKQARAARFASAIRAKTVRKADERMQPRLEELLATLPASTVNLVDKKALYIGGQRTAARLQRGAARLMEEEKVQFQRVLKAPDFRALPYGALQQAIRGRLEATQPAQKP